MNIDTYYIFLINIYSVINYKNNKKIINLFLYFYYK